MVDPHSRDLEKQSPRPDRAKEVEEIWRAYLTTGHVPGTLLPPRFGERDLSRLFRSLPHGPRCKLCYVPFKGPGGWIARHLLARRPSKLNPLVCDVCDRFVTENQGGVELELTMLFADVRGSTTLAEQMGAAEFSKLINRFFLTASEVLIHADALIEKLMGDGVAAYFVPGVAGEGHAGRAVDAARSLLRATGHGEEGGPWIPVGIGLHTGDAYVGTVGSQEGLTDIAVLGDTVNIAARLSAEAAAGEILASKATLAAAGVAADSEPRQFQLKGRAEAVEAAVLRSPRAD